MSLILKRISTGYIFASLLALALFFSVTQAYAQPATNGDAVRFSKVGILPERGTIKAGDEIVLATQLRLAPHWHVYWRNPGDSGLPVSIKWELPEGFEISEISWPTPDKISYETLVNYGYYDPVVLLQTLKVPSEIPQDKIPFKASYEILVCNDICIPEYDEISFHLNDPDAPTLDYSKAINAARAMLPQEIEGQFTFRDKEDVLHLSLMPEDSSILNNVTEDNTEFFPYDWGIIKHAAAPRVTLENGTIAIAHKRDSEAIDPQKMLKGLLVIKAEIGQNKGYVISAEPLGGLTTANEQSPKIANNNTGQLTFLSAVVLAFLGGLVLNLMPCVFPVLSIKALSLVEMKGQEAKEARLHGIAYTVGVILSFLLIAGVLIALKHAGTAIGWGFQLQNPIIVGLLAYLLFFIGLSLSGLIEIGSGLTSIGGKLAGNHSYTGSFFTGALATIVATPCTAPFMGAAMGFALTQSAFVSLTIFAVLGFGLALPYLLLSFIPAVRVLLPKPGAWMETFKQFLAFPMFASTLWLIWVLSQQAGTGAIFLALFGLLFLSFAVWLSRFSNLAARIIMIATIIGVIYTLSEMRNMSAPEATQTMSEKYTAISYSKDALAELLRRDEPVFVDMTAAWCITCKVNETTVLNTKTIQDLFAEKNVQQVVGDWTNRNAAITEYLDEHKRNGVPLYVYYGKPDPTTGIRPEPVILPQILTQAIVRNALEN